MSYVLMPALDKPCNIARGRCRNDAASNIRNLYIVTAFLDDTPH